jgi:hypothetical protein
MKKLLLILIMWIWILLSVMPVFAVENVILGNIDVTPIISSIAPSTLLFSNTAQNPTKIKKVNLSTFTETDSIQLNVGETGTESLKFVNGNYFYGFIALSPARIVRITIIPFARDSSFDLNIGENAGTCSTDISNGIAYCVSLTIPFIVTKNNLITMTRISSVTSGSATDQAKCGAYNDNNIFLVAANAAAFKGSVYVVDTTTMIITGSLLMNVNDQTAVSCAANNTHFYIGLQDNRGLLKVQINPLVRVGALDLGCSAGSLGIAGMAMDKAKNYLYACCTTIPTKLHKINLATFTIESTLILNNPTNLSGCEDVQIDASEEKIYVSSNLVGAPNEISRIDMGTFTETGRVTFTSAEDAFHKGITIN